MNLDESIVKGASPKIEESKFRRNLNLYDSTMVVAGSMIGSAIFIVSSDMSRQLGSSGWLLLSWMIAGLLTITGALSYGELAFLLPVFQRVAISCDRCI